MKQTSARLVEEVVSYLNKENVKQIAAELWVILQRQKMLGQIDRITDEVGTAFSLKQGRLRAKVYSQESLSEQQKNQILERLEKKFGKKIDLCPEVNKDLMGGVKVQIGDEVFDASYISKLQQLKQKLEGGV